MTIKKMMLIATFTLCASANTQANSNEAALDLIAVAKISGACGVYDEMVVFQQSSKMPGGELFIGQFVQAEATRLGKEVDELLETCVKASNYVAEAMKALKSE